MGKKKQPIERSTTEKQKPKSTEVPRPIQEDEKASQSSQRRIKLSEQLIMGLNPQQEAQKEEADQNENKSSPKKKQKMISKKSQKTGQKKKRPTYQKFQQPDPPVNPNEPIIQALIYIYVIMDIGLPQGFTFEEKQRKALIKQQKFLNQNQNKGRIEWAPKGEMNREKQIHKIDNYSKNITEFVERPQTDLSINQVRDLLLDISQYFCEESTGDVYKLFSEIFKSICRKQTKIQQQQRAKTLFNNEDFIFLSGKFTTLKIKNWIEIPRLRQKQRLENFTKMFKKLVSEVKKWPENKYQIRKFLSFHEQQRQQFEQIENCSKEEKKKKQIRNKMQRRKWNKEDNFSQANEDEMKEQKQVDEEKEKEKEGMNEYESEYEYE